MILRERESNTRKETDNMASQEHLIQKQAVVNEIKEKLEKAKSAVVVDYIGITVAQADAMRKKLREANVDYTVYKNTLVSRAIKDTGFEDLEKVLSGPSAFAFSYEDAVTPARVLNEIIKEYKKMEFKGGVIEGQYFDGEGVKSIATLPTRDQLIAKFMGSIQSPISKAVRTFQAIADAKEA
jgi:large subunit ribosomal protein L10